MAKKLNEIPGDGALRLTSLDVQNVLRIKAVSLKIDGDALVIEGDNEAGKTSLRQSLEMLLAGGRAISEDPIHGDAQTGTIVGTFGDIRVEKTLRRGKAPLFKITSPGATYTSPQSIVNALIGERTLDPIKFMKLDDEAKAKTIAGLMGFDSSVLDAKRKDAFDARTDAKREEKRLKSIAEGAPQHEGVSDSEISVKELLAELDAAKAHNAEGEDVQKRIASWTAKGKEHDAEIARLEAELVQRKIAAAQCAQYAKEAKDALAAFMPIDEDDIAARIDGIEEHNAKARDNAARAKAIDEWEEATEATRKCEENLGAIDAELERARSEATSRLPVDGLSMSDGAVLYNGKPLSQAGASAELRVSVAIAIAVNADKRVKLLCIDDAEKLSLANTRIVLEMARDAGFQVFLFGVVGKVGDGEAPCVLIEDGMVAA